MSARYLSVLEVVEAGRNPVEGDGESPTVLAVRRALAHRLAGEPIDDDDI